MRIQFAPRSKRDLDGIEAYLAERSPSAARKVIAAIHHSIGVLSEHPLSGEQIRGNALRARVVPAYPYRIFYLVAPERIEIVHIRHTSRKAWRGQMEQP